MNKLRLALLLLIVMIASGCCRKQIETITRTNDSNSYIEVVKIDTLKIDPDTIQETIFIKCDSLTSINRFYRSGRANLYVKLDEKGKLTLTATCDSLEKIIISKTIEIKRLKEQLTNQTVTKTQKRNLPIVVHLFIYFILIVLLLVMLKLIFKKYIL